MTQAPSKPQNRGSPRHLKCWAKSRSALTNNPGPQQGLVCQSWGVFCFVPRFLGGDSLACNVQLGRPTVPIAIAKSSRVRPCPTWAPLLCTISMQGGKAAYRRRTPCSPLVRPLPIVPNASPPHRPLCGSTKCLHYLALLKIIRCSSCVIKANTIS